MILFPQNPVQKDHNLPDPNAYLLNKNNKFNNPGNTGQYTAELDMGRGVGHSRIRPAKRFCIPHTCANESKSILPFPKAL